MNFKRLVVDVVILEIIFAKLYCSAKSVTQFHSKNVTKSKTDTSLRREMIIIEDATL